MKVIFFAQSRVAAGCGEFVLKAEQALSQDEFWQRLIAAFPMLERKGTRLARREEYLQPHEVIEPGDEIAVIPPVSGG